MDSQNSNNKEQSADKSASANHSSAYLKALSLMGITTGYIFGPLVVIGGLGWWLSSLFDQQWIKFVTVVIALVISNVLIFRNTEKHVKRLQR